MTSTTQTPIGQAGITATQLLLHLLNEAGSLSHHELMDNADEANDALKKRGVETGVWFRSPYCGHSWGEVPERALCYWLSNGFIAQNPEGNYELSKKGKWLFEDDEMRTVINRGLDDNTLSQLISAIRQVITMRS